MTAACEALRPAIDADRCLLGSTAYSRCRACADVCPHQALVCDETGLFFDDDVCTGCGLCAPACPEAVIAFPLNLDVRTWNRRPVVFLGCSGSESGATDPRDAGSVPCLGALGLREWTELHRRGVVSVLVRDQTCADCPAGDRNQALQSLQQFCRFQHSRSITPLELATLSETEWAHRRQRSHAVAEPDASRRRLFTRMLAAAAMPDRAALDATGLPRTGAADLVPWRPRIDAERCTGCDACVRVCPHGALALIDTDASPRYVSDAAACTGCRRCIDVCEDAAMELAGEGPTERGEWPLHDARCRACGAPFHQPRASDSPRCRICTRIDHSRMLHQVLP